MAKECPSCVNLVEDGQLFCPMCGTKLISGNSKQKKQPNQELESLLFTINANAEVALTKSLFWSAKNYNDLFTIESAYMELIQKFPTEARAYCAYANYAIDMVLKLDSIPVTSNFYLKEEQFNVILKRCRTYLAKAKEFAYDNELEQILQLDSALSSKVECLAADERLKKRQVKNKKIMKGLIIVSVAFLAIMIVLWIIANAAGI